MPYVALAHAGRIHYAERGERRPDRPSAVLTSGLVRRERRFRAIIARQRRGGTVKREPVPQN